MINIDEGQTEIKATEVDLTKPDPELLKKPKKGKKVTSEEFRSAIKGVKKEEWEGEEEAEKNSDNLEDKKVITIEYPYCGKQFN